MDQNRAERQQILSLHSTAEQNLDNDDRDTCVCAGCLNRQLFAEPIFVSAALLVQFTGR